MTSREYGARDVERNFWLIFGILLIFCSKKKGMPRIEAFLGQRGEKIKWSARLYEVSLKKKGAFSSKLKEEHTEKIFIVGKSRCFLFKPGTKVLQCFCFFHFFFFKKIE